MSISIAPTPVVRRDFRLVGGSHSMNVVLAPHVWNVRPGTLLRPTPAGWDVARDAASAKAVAVTQGRGGEKVHARKSATFDTYVKQFLPGDVLDVADVDDTGFITFRRAEDGPFYAESETEINISL